MNTLLTMNVQIIMLEVLRRPMENGRITIDQ